MDETVERYAVHWREGDGSASGVLNVLFTINEKEKVEKLLEVGGGHCCDIEFIEVSEK